MTWDFCYKCTSPGQQELCLKFDVSIVCAREKDLGEWEWCGSVTTTVSVIAKDEKKKAKRIMEMGASMYTNMSKTSANKNCQRLLVSTGGTDPKCSP